MLTISSEPAATDAAAVFVQPGDEVEGLGAHLTNVGFEAKAGQIATSADGDRTVFVVGVGAEAGDEQYRRAAGTLAKTLGHIESLTVTAPSAQASAIAAGLRLGAYRFGAYKADAREHALRTVVFENADLADVAAAEQAAARADAACWARDLVNTPAIDQAPATLAEALRERLGRHETVSLTVHDEAAIAEMQLGGLLGVAAGSHRPPRLVIAEYSGAQAGPLVVLVGKGIVFDSGGLSLKSASNMESMKTDMAGAATVMAVIDGAASLGLPVRLRALAPLTDNMPGGSALRPGDVITPRNGKTVEVLNTDAEGRLVLADGLALGAEAEPAVMIDVATLTGAAKVALGTTIGALFASEPPLFEAMEAAAATSGEAFWRMPLASDYRSKLDSDVADIKNIGDRWGGTITAALFLQEFVGETPWIHLDIAGPGRSEEATHYLTKGGTGFGVRTLLRYLEAFTSA